MRNPQSKSKWLLLLVAILIITNAISLYFLFYSQPSFSHSQERRSAILNFLKTDVGFTDSQLHQFDSLSNLHRENSKPLYDKSADRKIYILTQAASQNFSDPAIDSAAQAISSEQNKFESLMLQHLRNIRSLCTPDQLPKFDSGFYKLIVKRKRSAGNNANNK